MCELTWPWAVVVSTAIVAIMVVAAAYLCLLSIRAAYEQEGERP